MPAPSPDPEKLAQALHLRRTHPDMTLRQIADRIGVRSATTASTYIELAEQHERWFPSSRREQLGARVDMILAELSHRLMSRLDEKDAVVEKVSPAIVQVLQEISKRHGLYAPSRTVLETPGDTVPDRETTAAVRAALDKLSIESGDDHDGPNDGT